MFANEETKIEEHETINIWFIYWIGFLESFIEQNYSNGRIAMGIKELKGTAIESFNLHFNLK